ncbi:MAG: N-acetylglutaminylglutamine amidotransferase, partial [Gammaproteobacteria bacterium]
MSGFAGEARFDSSLADVGAVSLMCDTLASRGPDAAGALHHGRVALAHRRLGLVDLSERSQQPMTDPGLGLTVVLDGSIYNYREIRRELQALDYRFFSDGDTEVLLKSFHAWGRDCVERLEGIFAFAIHERDSGRVTLARDRFGVKPLYLNSRGDRLRFASSLPALLAAGSVDTAI